MPTIAVPGVAGKGMDRNRHGRELLLQRERQLRQRDHIFRRRGFAAANACRWFRRRRLPRCRSDGFLRLPGASVSGVCGRLRFHGRRRKDLRTCLRRRRRGRLHRRRSGRRRDSRNRWRALHLRFGCRRDFVPRRISLTLAGSDGFAAANSPREPVAALAMGAASLSPCRRRAGPLRANRSTDTRVVWARPQPPAPSAASAQRLAGAAGPIS